MRSISHLSGGAILSVGFVYNQVDISFIFGALIGSKAPDLLEFPVRTLNSKRIGLFPHRTLTHWVALWIFGFISAIYSTETIVTIFFIGFFLGGLVHLLQDACTPMGVPILLPFGKKSSLNLVKGNLTEFIINSTLFPLYFIVGYSVSKILSSNNL